MILIREVSKIFKREILYLRKYTEAFVEHKFLLNLKKSLIAANKVSDTDIPAFYKWVLYKLYLEIRVAIQV